MQVVISPNGFVNTKRPHQAYQDISNAGFTDTVFETGMVMNGYSVMQPRNARKSCQEYHIPYIPDDPYTSIRTMMQPSVNMAHSMNIDMPIAAIPALPHEDIRHERYDLNDEWCRIQQAALELVVEEHCNSVIMAPEHMCIPLGDEFRENLGFYKKMIRTAENAGADDFYILLKNESRYYEGRYERGVLSDPQTASEWIDEFNKISDRVRFGMCVDIGDLNLCGIDTYEYCSAMGERIRAVILRDNDGHSNDSNAPFFCMKGGQGTEWLSVIRGLRAIHFDGDLIIEAGSTAAGIPIIMRDDLLKYLHRIGKYFEWQIHMGDTMQKYDHIVLFGAGNMCRNYLKNYGKEYPPLFTCDNNPDRWGEDFYGLTIEPPDRLKNLPENTGIYICNIYYRDIEAQLREMGISENIEYFNDEYLDTFYMDRLKGL